MARVSNTEARRAQIADAMVGVVAALGYERASVAEVAKAAGVAPGLLHYHFTTKREVFVAMIGRLAASHLARIDRWMARADDPATQVARFVDCHLARGAEEDPAALACWVAVTAEALRDEAVRGAYEEAARAFVARLEPAVREALRARRGDGEGARAAATAIFAAIQGYYALHGAAPGMIPRGSAAPAVHALAEALIHGGPESPNPRRR
jgi:TetR/AcrR family transcriptional repressor of bet genes